MLRKLLGNSVAISDRAIVKRYKDAAPPKSWLKSAMLRNHRLLEFEPASGDCLGDTFMIHYDDDLGLRKGGVDAV
jgi:hypothetical protein